MRTLSGRGWRFFFLSWIVIGTQIGGFFPQESAAVEPVRSDKVESNCISPEAAAQPTVADRQVQQKATALATATQAQANHPGPSLGVLYPPKLPPPNLGVLYPPNSPVTSASYNPSPPPNLGLLYPPNSPVTPVSYGPPSQPSVPDPTGSCTPGK